MQPSVNVDKTPKGRKVVVRRSTGIEVRCIDDEILVIDEAAGVIFNLNPIGKAVWKLLETPTSCEQIVEILTAAFPEVAPQQIAEDVEAILGQLESNGLTFSRD